MSYGNELILSPNWPGFSRVWKIVAIILFLLLLILWLIQASPWSENGCACAAQPTATDEAVDSLPAGRSMIADPAESVFALPDTAKLYFENNSAEFPADVELSLSAIIAYLNRNKDLIAVISGYHSATGSLEHNQELAKQRAQAVSRLLQESGIGAGRIVLQKPVETTGSGTDDEARRVEVSIRLR